MDILPDGGITLYNRPAAFNAAPAPITFVLHAKPPPAAIGNILAAAAEHYSLDAGLLSAVAWQESGYRSDAVSTKGAKGIMQLMPQTARALGVDSGNPAQNIFGGAAYLRQMLDRYSGDTTLALAAYNAGPGAVDKFSAVPPFAETQNYVRRILGGSVPSFEPAVFVFNP